jgi:hypothetical protein
MRAAAKLVLVVAYTAGLTSLVAVASLEPSIPISPEVFVAALYGFTLLGGIGVGALVADLRILWLSGAVFVLGIPITIFGVIVRDPAPDGQGGLVVLVVAMAALAGLAAGLGLARWRSDEPTRRHEPYA